MRMDSRAMFRAVVFCGLALGLALPACQKSDANTSSCQDPDQVKGQKSCDACCKAKGSTGANWMHNTCTCSGGK